MVRTENWLRARRAVVTIPDLLEELPQSRLGAARYLPHLLAETLRTELAGQVVEGSGTCNIQYYAEEEQINHNK